VAARGLGSASRRLLVALLELGEPDSGSAQRASHAAGVLVPLSQRWSIACFRALPRPNTASFRAPTQQAGPAPDGPRRGGLPAVCCAWVSRRRRAGRVRGHDGNAEQAHRVHSCARVPADQGRPDRRPRRGNPGDRRGVEARAAADRHITDCRRAYADVRRAALTAGWTADELDQLGWAVEHGTQPACRRRSAGRPSQPPATATAALEPAPGGAGAVTATSAERDSATSSAEPSDALPDGSGPDEAPVHEAVPVKYPDPQPVG
jgi:hypothetical protein